MKFLLSTEYAVHGLISLSLSSSGKAVLLGEIAEAVKVTESYLRKVFQLLSKRGIVVSRRGAKGGYFLGRKSEQISLKDVVEAIEGSSYLYNCLMVQRGCSIFKNCPVREAFEKASERMFEILEKTSIADLADAILKNQDNNVWLKVTK